MTPVDGPGNPAADPNQHLKAGRDLVRQTALLLADDLTLPQVFERLADLLRGFVDASAVRFWIGGDPETRYEYSFGEPAGEEGASIEVPIVFGDREVGRLRIQTPSRSPERERDVLLLESCAVYLGARIHDEAQRADVQRLKQLAWTDGLTSLPNRRSLDEALASEWQRCARSQSPLSLLLLDIDYFKVFNDTYGHLAGDGCLRQVARAIAASVKRPGDLAARYGGEEFAILLPETSLESAQEVGVSVADAVRALAVPHQGSTLGRVTVSLGCASAVPKAHEDPHALILQADEQLYRAKENGRNRVASGRAISDAPPAHRAIVVKHNLPRARTSFVGRSKELAALESMTMGTRLITIVGHGGAGKTRLARELALRIADRYPDGTWFVDLTSVSGGEDAVAQAIATAMSPTATNVTLPLLEQYVRGKDVLLILDNSEHLIDDAARVADRLLDREPDLHVVATSREPLAIEGEVVYRLPLLDASESARLFRERAQAAGMETELGEAQADAIEQIVRKLEGLPLAIEIAATRAAAMEPAALLERLSDRLPAPPPPPPAGARPAPGRRGSRSAPSRHQTLEAVLAWSYDLLGEEARAIFRRTAIFAGGWTLESAAAVCTEGLPAEPTSATLDELVAKSLVVRDDSQRYRLLDSTREYGRLKLDALGELASLRLAHALHFHDYAAGSPAASAAAFASIERRERPELPNYRAALETLLETPGYAGPAADMLWNLRIVLGDFMSEFAHFAGAIGRALESPGLSVAARARLLVTLASMLEKKDAPHAMELAKEGAALLRQANDAAGWAFAIEIFNATALTATGTTTTPSTAVREEALAIARAANDRWLAAHLLVSLAVAYANETRLEEAVEKLSEAARMADPADRAMQAIIYGNMGVAQMQLHSYDRAVEALRQSIAIARETRPWWAVFGLINLTLVNVLRWDPSSARAALAEVLDLLRTYPNLYATALTFDAAALLAAGAASPEVTVQLAGFAQACFKNTTRQEYDQKLFDKMLAEMRVKIDEGAFEAAWIKGQSLTLEDAARVARRI